ncbi:UNKNOWN [Stylonychia lemnae]|uniref:Uncharacterized protein n=1 Tax=Stylonychia lemnae TaxID=5949 RepID=A0A078AWE3_STYLE|nr:UNKNOWN [Stylonychia lemnae]|eukprot:CDW86371.1 UNKNOWN [Stylonychia lemnae]
MQNILSTNKKHAFRALRFSQLAQTPSRQISQLNQKHQNTSHKQRFEKDQSKSWIFNSLVGLGSLFLAYQATQQHQAFAEGENQQEEQKEFQSVQDVQANTEENQQVKPQDQEVQQQKQESIMKDLVGENIKEVMTNKENKFIFFYRSSKLSQDDFQKVEEHATKMFNGLRILPYKIDLDSEFNELSKYLKERNPATEATVDKQIEDNSFLLANQYGDIWFWEYDLIKYFFGELLEQIFNFYQGPLKLMAEEQIIMNSSTGNDFHIIAYIDDYNNVEGMKKLKNYRKFHTKNTDKFFHFKFWLTENKELAQKLKIDTNPEAIGQIYLVRQSNHFNNRQKNVKLCDYDYHSQKILSAEDVNRDVQGAYAKILQNAFNSPIVIHDYMTFANLSQKYKSSLLVVYCDEKEDPKKYNELLRSLIKARKAMPINLKPDENGELQKSQRHQDVIFVMSTTKSLMPITKIHSSQPQALFITPDSEFVNLFNNYLPQLEKVEGMSPDEFLKKALNIDSELKEIKEEENQNRKDTMKLLYSPDRFIMNKMYHTDDPEILSDFQKLVDFVKQSVNGELKCYWDTENVPKTKYAQKIVGEDFDKRVMQGNKDAVVLVYHPIKEKNRELVDKFEEFVRTQDADQGISPDGQVVYGKYNGINESNTFKSPKQLPSILYFKKVKDQDEKEIIALDSIQDLLVKSPAMRIFAQSTRKEKRIQDFIRVNTPSTVANSRVSTVKHRNFISVHDGSQFFQQTSRPQSSINENDQITSIASRNTNRFRNNTQTQNTHRRQNKEQMHRSVEQSERTLANIDHMNSIHNDSVESNLNMPSIHYKTINFSRQPQNKLNKSYNGYPTFVDRMPNRNLANFQDIYGPKYSESQQRIKSFILKLKETKREEVNKTFDDRITEKYSDSQGEVQQRRLILIKRHQLPGKSRELSRFEEISQQFNQYYMESKKNKAAIKIQRYWREYHQFMVMKYKNLTLKDIYNGIQEINLELKDQLVQKVMQPNLERFYRSICKRAVFIRTVTSAGRLMRLFKTLEHAFNSNQQRWFYYKYEKTFEKQIREKKADKILQYQNVIRSQDKDENERQFRMNDIKKLLQIKPFSQIKIDFPENQYIFRGRRNSIGQTRIEKFMKVMGEFRDLEYNHNYQPSPPKKPNARKLLTKQKQDLQNEFNTLLKQEIEDFKKHIDYKPPKPKHTSPHKASFKSRKQGSSSSLIKKKQTQRKNSEIIPSSFKRLFNRNRTRIYSNVNDGSPSSNKNSNVPQSFSIKEGNITRFHTLIPRPMDYDSSKDPETISIGEFKTFKLGSIGNIETTQSAEETSSSDDSSVKFYQRECCKKCLRVKENPDGVHNHDPWRTLSEKIQRLRSKEKRTHRIILHGINTKNEMKGQVRDDQGLDKEKIKEIRRRQFFNFFADFYDKYERGAFGKDLSYHFSDEEKEKNLKRYFKKYYRDDLFLPSVVVDIPIECNMAAQKRLCECYIKKNQSYSKNRVQRKIKVKMLVGREQYEKREEYLGMSPGIQNTFVMEENMQELNELLREKTKQIHRRNRTQLVQPMKKEEIYNGSLAKKILENTFESRIERLAEIKNRRESVIRKGEIVTESFEKAFPDYNKILTQYGSSRIFNQNMKQNESFTKKNKSSHESSAMNGRNNNHNLDQRYSGKMNRNIWLSRIGSTQKFKFLDSKEQSINSSKRE